MAPLLQGGINRRSGTGDPYAIPEREACVWALGEIGDTSATQALKEALKDDDDKVQQAAAEALKKIRGEEPPK